MGVFCGQTGSTAAFWQWCTEEPIFTGAVSQHRSTGGQQASVKVKVTTSDPAKVTQPFSQFTIQLVVCTFQEYITLSDVTNETVWKVVIYWWMSDWFNGVRWEELDRSCRQNQNTNWAYRGLFGVSDAWILLVFCIVSYVSACDEPATEEVRQSNLCSDFVYLWNAAGRFQFCLITLYVAIFSVANLYTATCRCAYISHVYIYYILRCECCCRAEGVHWFSGSWERIERSSWLRKQMSRLWRWDRSVLNFDRI